MFETRPYQTKMLTATNELLTLGHRRLLLQGPTGMGKTAIIAKMIKGLTERGHKTWFVVHRRELIKQSITAFEKVDLKFGVVAPGFIGMYQQPVQIASIQTLVKRHIELPQPEFIIIDEAHHTPAMSWKLIHQAYPKARFIGLTATPERLDGAGLSDYFDKLILGPSVDELIEGGYLSPFRVYAPFTIDMDGARKVAGDYVRSESARRVDRPAVVGDVIKEYRKYAYGKRAVVFTTGVQHAMNVQARFKEAGIGCEMIEGKLSSEVRDGVLERFEKGDTPVLVSIDIVSEGFDLPAIECAILLRPTASKSLYLQQVGRALRPYPGKEYAIILDHVGNTARFGLPNHPHEWSLEGVKGGRRGKTEANVAIKICPLCFAAQKPGPVCIYCNGKIPKSDRGMPEEREGELKEVTGPAMVESEYRENGEYQRLLGLERAKGYKRGWAWHVFQAKMQKLARVR